MAAPRLLSLVGVLLCASKSTVATVLTATNETGSVQACVNQLASSASACYLSEGVYRLDQTILVQDVHGTSGSPKLIAAAPNATVTFDGTVDVPDDWSWRSSVHTFSDGTTVTRGHWVAPWPDGRPEPWQLFIDDEMMVVARWPNARWDDKTVFDDTYWAHGSPWSTYCGDELRDLQYAGPCRLVDGTADPTPAGSRSLAASGINATGASAVLNIGHWFSFGAKVLEHEPGSSNFTYERDSGGGGWKAAKYKPTADLYYLEGALSLLDAETEWHYERSAREIHLKTRGDVDPTGQRVAARVQEYAIAAKGISHVTFKDLGFFATTIYAGGEGTSIPDDVHHVRFDSLRLVHPSATKRVLGEARFAHPTTLARKKSSDSSANELFNCSFFGAEGHPLINSAGSGMLFDNNLVEWTDWSAVTTRAVAYFDATTENNIWGKYGSGAMTLEIDRSIILDAPNRLRRNSVHHSGPSVGLAITADNVHSELNHVSHQYAIQEDVRGLPRIRATFLASPDPRRVGCAPMAVPCSRGMRSHLSSAPPSLSGRAHADERPQGGRRPCVGPHQLAQLAARRTRGALDQVGSALRPSQLRVLRQRAEQRRQHVGLSRQHGAQRRVELQRDDDQGQQPHHQPQHCLRHVATQL